MLWALGNVGYATQKVVNVGIYDNPPKIFIDKSGQPSGIFVDLLNQIATIDNWKINYHFSTWEECLHQLENGSIDLLPDVAITSERKNHFEFNTIPVLESWSQIYVKNNKEIHQLGDLSGKRVALLNGSVQQSNFRQTMKGYGFPYTEVTAGSFTEALSLVSIEVADAAITNVFFGDLNASEFDLRKTSLIFNPVTLYFAIHPSGDTSLINTIDLYLTVWKNTPRSFYYSTLQKYTLSEPLPNSNPNKLFLVVIVLISMVAFIILLKSKQGQIQKLSRQIKDQQRLLHNQEDKFRGYFESSPIGMFVADTRGRYIDVNPAACSITGYQEQELKNLTIADLIPESGRKGAAHHFNQLVTEGRAEGTMPFRSKSGEIRHWSVNAVKIEEDKLIGFVEDITEKTKLEEERFQIPEKLERQVKEKTQELNLRISELEHFREVTIERELRMEELRSEIKRLKNKQDIH
ncbi:diguanylate cyclase/phosphodiesterase [Geofilum rubicundum JCM 15548]|uniref:Diguanylate cyclase/phosphodiesterase n=2 Tax=Geofilum TaxID=1236988 RepID=A0A0E9LVE0_9BACT|nr:diguanylate cyclase/phosphodiesterase [Geofilum rubicundum JCM 15548]